LRLGICCPLSLASQAIESGFDYAEVPAFEIASSENFDSYKGLALDCTNLFCPHGTILFGGKPFDWRSYVIGLLPRCAELGVRVMTIGSGRARSAEEDEVEDIEERFLEMVFQIQRMATPLGIRIAPENLSFGETNVWTSFGRLSSACRERELGCTLDVYHFLNNHESMASFPSSADQLPAHVHLADASRSPAIWDDKRVVDCVQRLNAAGYDGRMSIEANQSEPEHWGNVAEQVRKLILE
jgi:sugar phosphate isomerase/epimerase